MRTVTIARLREMKQEGEKFVCLTAYEASLAHVSESAGVELLLVGDSLGMVVQGHDSTLPVTVDDIIYHCKAVQRGSQHALIMADMPFISHITPQQAVANAGRMMQEGGAHIVKIEGGQHVIPIVKACADFGIPVCGHLGLRPQSVNKLSGYKVQGRDKAGAQAILYDAKALQDAGCDMMLLECVPVSLAQEISSALHIPVIGIGAGSHCDGQVLVVHDMLGITPGKRPRFVQDFLKGRESVHDAIAAYVKAVKDGSFPSTQQSFE